MNLKIDFNTAQFRAAAKDAVEKMGANAELLIKEEGRLAIGEWQKRIPPFTKGGYGKNIGSAADHDQGRKAVKNDLGNIAQGANQSYLEFVADSFGLVQIQQQLFKKGSDKPYLIDWDKIAFSIEELRSFHLKKRNRYGRTPTQGRGFGSNDKTIGRWKARERLIVPYQIMAQYLNELYDAIGSAKATFNAAAMRLGARLPSWVRRHGALGSYSESKNPSFSITIGGNSSYPRAQAALDEAIAIRGKKLEAELRRIMNGFARTGKILTRRRSFNSK